MNAKKRSAIRLYQRAIQLPSIKRTRTPRRSGPFRQRSTVQKLVSISATFFEFHRSAIDNELIQYTGYQFRSKGSLPVSDRPITSPKFLSFFFHYGSEPLKADLDSTV